MGTEIQGFQVSIGGIFDPSEVKRRYDDIEEILGKNKVNYKTHEERNDNGTFRLYTVQTG